MFVSSQKDRSYQVSVILNWFSVHTVENAFPTRTALIRKGNLESSYLFSS